jgi:hypothetical protein
MQICSTIRDVHGPLHLCFPAGIRGWSLCKGTIHKGSSSQQVQRRRDLVPQDRLYPFSRSKNLDLCQTLFGKVTLLGSPWTAVDPIVIALPESMVVMILMQWQSGKRQQATVAAESSPYPA